MIVIPGIMGSRLVAEKEAALDLGRFRGRPHARPSLAAEAQHLIGLEMRRVSPWTGSRRIRPDRRCLGRLPLHSSAGIPLRRRVYGNVLSAMGISGYHEVPPAKTAHRDHGAPHAAAFEFDYDWRRSLDETGHPLPPLRQPSWPASSAATPAPP